MKKTEILVITDRSGSMASIANDIIGGYNQFIEDQKTETGQVRVTYTQFDAKNGAYLWTAHTPAVFPTTVGTPLSVQIPMPTVPQPADDSYQVVYQGLPLSEVPKLTRETFVPRGGTALYDAIGRTLNEQGERIKREAWADLVVVYIITDGGENSSRKYNQEQIKTMVQHAEAHGWKFIYLGANQDAWETARSFGSNAMYSQTYDATTAGTNTAYASASATLKSFRRGVEISSNVLQSDFDESIKKAAGVDTKQ